MGSVVQTHTFQVRFLLYILPRSFSQRLQSELDSCCQPHVRFPQLNTNVSHALHVGGIIFPLEVPPLVQFHVPSGAIPCRNNPDSHDPLTALVVQVKPGIFNLSQVMLPDAILSFVIAPDAIVLLVIEPLCSFVPSIVLFAISTQFTSACTIYPLPSRLSTHPVFPLGVNIFNFIPRLERSTFQFPASSFNNNC